MKLPAGALVMDDWQQFDKNDPASWAKREKGWTCASCVPGHANKKMPVVEIPESKLPPGVRPACLKHHSRGLPMTATVGFYDDRLRPTETKE